MAKKIDSYIKLQIKAGNATPAPPIGPALGQKGVNIMEFCKAFNAATQDKMGLVVPVVITVFSDKSFTFITKSPPAPVLLKLAAKVEKGAGDPLREKVGKVTWDQCLEIGRTKMEDLNANDEAQAARMIAGTARSMGLTVEGAPAACGQTARGPSAARDSQERGSQPEAGACTAQHAPQWLTEGSGTAPRWPPSSRR